MSNAFDRIWHAGLLHKLKSYANAGVRQGFIHGPTLFLLYTDDLPDNVICDIAIYADDTLYSKCDQASDLWQQLELASELESDLQDTVNWGMNWLVNFNAEKTQLISFNRSNNNGSIDVTKCLRHLRHFVQNLLGVSPNRLQNLKILVTLWDHKNF